MPQILCSTPKCNRYSSEEMCNRCRRKSEPAPEATERNLLECTQCGYEAANRGILSLHVRREHSPKDEDE